MGKFVLRRTVECETSLRSCKKMRDVTPDEIILTIIVDAPLGGVNSPFLIQTLNGTIGIFGITVPVVNGNECPHSSQQSWDNFNWDYSIIYLPTELFENEDLSDEEMKNTLQHEIGHSLKLRHPSELSDLLTENVSLTYPSLMQEGGVDTSTGSNYLGAIQHYASQVMTIFDYSALNKKWVI